ncbi:uncharacterized protein Z520_06673 [Fonsecaea multimorphosa CBS 102226]|uniref:Uncharacterized protein n=1 Tax=Fonsecaea multimorphosa CBS 102226 TaxID=1442371 RepID=A0A0D2H7V9_9EURO|nr:uncharacterized protein Z520_06673 [Fonsecaea multimorphosa CBS 102226]KIX97895.1 hypothetical protein Z520_06673 [Fonsecaea multimorphosa CBS 102226]OAL23665.1 hypothetical protein AYO22_06242 [Fonsecaea multimorphosa]
MASSAGLAPLPTSVHHSTTRLTHSQAHTFLSAFLDRAENDAAYRPDSTLTERGPQALSSGSTPNLTLSHLKRILSGMEGKRIGGSLELEKRAEAKGEENTADEELEGLGESDETQTPRERGSQKRALDEDEAENEDQQTPVLKKQKRKIIYSVNSEGVEDPQVGADIEAGTPGQDRVDDDWQDAETYALAQTGLHYDNAAAAEGQLEFEGEDQDDNERKLEEQEATTELDNSNAAENQSHTPLKKRKQQGGDDDADREGGAQKAKKKKATDTVMAKGMTSNGNKEMSKEERKKMKKMRQKDEKKERQREREERNKNR